ncbi:MAG: murein L,D-transpeptidase [Actinobacteria bacterium]|nr:murein L,D-transpeptidase [Actinomycetota bacterium]
MKMLRWVMVCGLLSSVLGFAPSALLAAPIRREVPLNLFRTSPFPLPVMSVRMTSGAATQVVQVRLLSLGFWLKAASGEYDFTTRQAVMAFQKFAELPVTGSVDEETADAILHAERPLSRSEEKGLDKDVVEVDLDRQLTFVVRKGVTEAVLNVSTGTGKPYVERSPKNPNIVVRDVADTPKGRFRVEKLRTDGWWSGDLGSIYRPIYFLGGIAFHGSAVIPAYPASHGCVRVSVDAMDMLWETGLLEKWDDVWVY